MSILSGSVPDNLANNDQIISVIKNKRTHLRVNPIPFLVNNYLCAVSLPSTLTLQPIIIGGKKNICEWHIQVNCLDARSFSRSPDLPFCLHFTQFKSINIDLQRLSLTFPPISRRDFPHFLIKTMKPKLLCFPFIIYCVLCRYLDILEKPAPRENEECFDLKVKEDFSYRKAGV